MIMGYEFKKERDKDVVVVKDLKLGRLCLNSLSDKSPFRTSLYKGQEWDYLCILEDTMFLELVNLKTNTVYLSPRVREVVIQESRLDYNNINLALQNIGDLSAPYKTNILYYNILGDNLATIIDTFNRSDNGNELILVIPNLREEMLEGSLSSHKKVYIILEEDKRYRQLEESKEIDAIFRGGMKSIPLGTSLKDTGTVLIYTDEEPTPAMAMALTHVIRGIQ